MPLHRGIEWGFPLRLRCFVAMAFGKADTDSWYDNVLKPLLEANGLAVRRVDRITHNDDVDDRIIMELEKADLVIADLTYARPSVYFEAGYAQRKVPVIYTVRADHLGTGAVDSERVHFDLSMKNLHSWREVNDANFSKRLSAVVRLVTRPMLEQQARSRTIATQERLFRTLPLRERVPSVAEAIMKSVRAEKTFDFKPRAARAGMPTLVGSASNGSDVRGFSLLARQKFLKADLNAALDSRMLHPAYNLQPRGRTGPIERIDDLVVLASLESVPLSRVTTVLHMFRILDEQRKHFQWFGDEDWGLPGFEEARSVHAVQGYPGRYVITPTRSGTSTDVRVPPEGEEPPNRRVVATAKNVPRTLDVVVIDSIRSREDAAERARDIVRRWRTSLDASV